MANLSTPSKAPSVLLVTRDMIMMYVHYLTTSPKIYHNFGDVK